MGIVIAFQVGSNRNPSMCWCGKRGRDGEGRSRCILFSRRLEMLINCITPIHCPILFVHVYFCLF